MKQHKLYNRKVCCPCGSVQDNNLMAMYPLLQTYDTSQNLETMLQKKPLLHKSCRLFITRKRKVSGATQLSVDVRPKQMRSESKKSPSFKKVCSCVKKNEQQEERTETGILSLYLPLTDRGQYMGRQRNYRTYRFLQRYKALELSV